VDRGQAVPNPLTNGTQRDDDQDDKREWHEAVKLLGVKMVNNKRFYKVQWKNGDPPTFENKDDVSEFLKREYHRTRTLTGTLRKNSLNKRRPHVRN